MIGLVWAQTTAGVIGAGNAIPWRIPEDTAHFRELTMGHPVIMGRRTWDSLPPRFRPLGGRRNIVLTRQPGWRAPGAEPVATLDAARRLAGEHAWIIGGSEIYAAAMPFADELRVTEIDVEVTGDRHAPAITPDWTLVADGGWQLSSAGPRFRFLRYVRGQSLVE